MLVTTGTLTPSPCRDALALVPDRDRRGRATRLIGATLLSLAAACGPPVDVHREHPRVVTAELERSALTSRHPSTFSATVLYRWNLTARFEKDPEGALAELRDRVLADPSGRSNLFALAELSFRHADASGKREFYLASAVYAYTFLFPGTNDQPLEKLDPRVRIAADLYNRGLTGAFVSKDDHYVELSSAYHPLPFGQQIAVYLDPASLRWGERELEKFVPVAELRVTGLGTRYRTAGIGAPLAASVRPLTRAEKPRDYVAPNAKVPITAFLRIDDARAQLAQPTINASIEMFNAYDTRSVEIDGRQVPLEVEPSAALAYSLSRSNVWSWELRGFLRGDFLREQAPVQIAFVEPYRPGRIPVVFVHGTASSPGRWADMLNVLSNTAPLRDRYQCWFFFYETGNPIPYSSMRLRETLTKTLQQLDPQGKDPALQHMVVIGHSQGGLLTRMTAIDSGTRLWDTVSRKPIDQLHVGSETRDVLQRSFFVKPLPFVRRVIFISTPHRGSYVAAWSISHFASRFARLPVKMVNVSTELLKGNRDALVIDPEHAGFGAVYGMTPGSPFIKALASIPLSPDVTAHSIIPVRGDLPPDGQADGVVKYDSAHIDGVESELVVTHCGHSAQGNPVAIEETRRILIEHADEVCRTSHVACRHAETRPASEAAIPAR